MIKSSSKTSKRVRPLIAPADIVARYSERPDVGRDFLTISVPNGWDDVKRLTNRVLQHEGRKFVFTGWNSDRNECFFVAPHGGSAVTATVI